MIGKDDRLIRDGAGRDFRDPNATGNAILRPAG